MTETPSGGVLVAPAQRDLSQLADDLVAWLSSRIPAASGLAVSDLQYPRGAGQSHETILFAASWSQDGKQHQRELVVRIKPTTFTVFDDDMFEEQYQLMRVLHETGHVRVAETMWLERDASILGSAFFIMEKLHGRVPVSIPNYMVSGWVVDADEQQRRTLWTSAVRELARVATMPLERLEFLESANHADGFDMEWDRWDRTYQRLCAEHALPRHEQLRAELMSRLPAHRPPGLTWGDARIGNMMVDDDFQVVALMDWEQPSLGGALQDLGWWLFNYRLKVAERGGESLPGLGDRAHTIDLWEQETGILATDIDWYEAFAGFKMACLAVNMRAMRGQDTSREALGQLPHLREAAAILGMTFHD